MKKTAKLLAFLMVAMGYPGVAQPVVEMADTMRSEGKIYVVVAIMLVIFLGLMAYLFLMDRKISRLEKRMAEKKR
jgi:CcmD family protein